MVKHAHQFTPHPHVTVMQTPVRYGVRAPDGSHGHTYVIGAFTHPCVQLNNVDETQLTDA